MSAAELAALSAEITRCRACPRLVDWREQVAATKRAAFADWDYWGRPVPGFGDPNAAVVIVGLAPAAHGANRTGRVFTGDRSGDFLYAALHRAGMASQDTAVSRDDGLELHGAYVTAAVRCAPPANKPSPAERDACRPFLERELAMLPRARVALALGGFAWNVVTSMAGLRPRPKFGHAAVVQLDSGALGGVVRLIGAFHPSQQNTFTGRLTPQMLDDVLTRARQLADRSH